MYDYTKKSVNSLIVMNNGKILKANKIQTYEDPREKRMEGIYNGKSFAYIQKKPKFSLFPEKHVSFQPNTLSPSSENMLYKKRTPTPYPRAKKNKTVLSTHKRKSKKNMRKTKRTKI